MSQKPKSDDLAVKVCAIVYVLTILCVFGYYKKHQMRPLIRYEYINVECQNCKPAPKVDIKSKLELQGKKLVENDKCKVLQNKLNCQNQKVKRLQT